MSKLPNRPSDLIRLGLSDMEKAEASPHYEVDQNVWHKPDPRRLGTCLVCNAGSIMAMTLMANKRSCFRPGDFDYDTEGKLLAVDSFRMGEVTHAFHQMGLGKPPIDDIDVALYGVSPDDFRRDQRELATTLEAAGF